MSSRKARFRGGLIEKKRTTKEKKRTSSSLRRSSSRRRRELLARNRSDVPIIHNITRIKKVINNSAPAILEPYKFAHAHCNQTKNDCKFILKKN
jgi:hypothetical protein